MSCPDNLGPERDIVKSVVPELNQVLEQSHGVVLKVLNWTDLLPGVGSEGQDVINSQVDGAYDIYLGILGARFGDPTRTAGSGTEEEFDHAYQRYVSDPANVRILFYFKDGLEHGVLKLDVDQLRRVQEFRAKLKKEGVLYAQFSNSDEFLKLIKEHLSSLVMKQWDKGQWRVLSRPEPAAPPTLPDALATLEAQPTKFEDSGAGDNSSQMPGLDALILSMESLKLATAAVERMGELIQNMGSSMQNTTKKITASVADSKPMSPQSMKVVMDGFASDLHDFAIQLRREVVSFRSGTDTGLAALERVIDFQMDELHSDVASLRAAYGEVSKYTSNIRNTRDLIRQFRDTISDLPSFTGPLRISKGQVVDSLDQFQATVAITLDKLETIDRKLGGPGPVAS